MASSTCQSILIHYYSSMNLRNALPLNWKKYLNSQFNLPYMIELQEFLDNQELENKKIYPNKDHLFNAFKYTSFQKTKVVILGQDPYHGEKQAHGLSFSVQKNIKPPPSLNNIFKELKSDIDFKIPNNGDLSPWAKQGVLLLNDVLTVEHGQAHSHKKKGWEQFTGKVIDILNTKKSNLIFLLWGAAAHKKGKNIDLTKHFVLTAPHPSPLSSYRGFFGCKHFSKTNRILKKLGLSEINWTLKDI